MSGTTPSPGDAVLALGVAVLNTPAVDRVRVAERAGARARVGGDGAPLWLALAELVHASLVADVLAELVDAVALARAVAQHARLLEAVEALPVAARVRALDELARSIDEGPPALWLLAYGVVLATAPAPTST